MIIRGAEVYLGDHKFRKKELYVSGERIVKEESQLAECDREVLDAGGLYAIPGLVDIHFHGAAGYDFCDADLEGLRRIGEFEAQKGVLAICPATMTYSEEILNGIVETAVAWRRSSFQPEREPETEKGADLLGIHMEGPFISPGKSGAQNPGYLMKPDVEMFRRLQEKSGNLIKLVDLAPELEGAMEFIECCHDQAVISLAHSNADYETAVRAFRKGARHVTHLYHAMPGIHHREPGPVIAALEEGAMVELICDGIHVHPAVVRFTFRAFGADKVILISDSMRACGMPDGIYQLGGQDVAVKGNRAVLAEKPDTIAGSVTCLFDCMRKAVLEMGIPLEQAVRAAAENPAAEVGAGEDYGSLEPGHVANILLVDEKLELRGRIQRGRVSYLFAENEK